MRLHCGNCGEKVEFQDEVCLDKVNTIVHKDCFRLDFVLKDFGTLEKLLQKYNFFKEIRQK